ncbi:MAG: Histidinol dehydrogenase [Lentisphaerae bacterium ADurb.BinA184]|nr:MAG: Histidinol dehydrogenase [Lentisphaerae bacterium ADurb.BinA184]
METLRHTNARFERGLRKLINRSAFDPDIERAVATILKDVREDGDKALVECALTYDRVELTPEEFAVSPAEVEAAERQTPPRVRKAIRDAHRQIRDFARRQRPRPWLCSPRPGVMLGEQFAPFSRVACYVPGGTAPLVSTVLHTVTLAAAAGVREIVVTSPARGDKSLPPAVLYAAACAGATEIYRLGGVYAIGAFAYGTETIRPVEKIVGPGNAFVTAAKRQVYGHVSIDLVAGPSEVMIIADGNARPEFIAADMLSQIEHGSGREQAVLVTTADGLLKTVRDELERQTARRSRSARIRRCLERGTFLVLVENLKMAAALANAYAPEHLEIMTANPGAVARQITAAGAIFLGPWTPEPVGDFVAGPSHVLPTGGSARLFSGLTVEQFCRRMSVIRYERHALRREMDTIEALAEVEGLDAHRASVTAREGRDEGESRVKARRSWD